MTLPHEELRALRYTREFLRELACGPRMPTLVLRERARDCLKHYPYDLTISKKWEDEVCEHGDTRSLCRVCEKDEVNE